LLTLISLNFLVWRERPFFSRKLWANINQRHVKKII
jgi:hypothetical protein